MKETLESWNRRLDDQASAFIDLSSKVKGADSVIRQLCDTLNTLESTVSEMKTLQATYLDEFLNIQRHQDEMMAWLEVGFQTIFLLELTC